eukprot:10457997-Prorocentrum_lima.AAC.1
MTSSLVGSEMCIRDREFNITVVPIRFVAGRRATDLGSSKCYNLSCEEAVSYTHLTLPTICSV